MEAYKVAVAPLDDPLYVDARSVLLVSSPGQVQPKTRHFADHDLVDIPPARVNMWKTSCEKSSSRTIPHRGQFPIRQE